jgi:major membrane immunogen (membrane-anchored lipoprotein)
VHHRHSFSEYFVNQIGCLWYNLAKKGTLGYTKDIAMKKIYLTFMVLSFIFLASCSKDFLKSYNKRMIGTGYISDVDRVGIGGSTSNLSFREGTFVFRDDRTVDYTDPAGVVYNGTWRIEKKPVDDENNKHTLHITVVDYISQRFLSQYYDEMNFVSTNHFKTRVESTFRSYVTHFRR